MSKNYLSIINHYNECFKKHGSTYKGVDWPNEKDLETRFRIMLDIIKYQTPKNKINLLDLGCGFGLLLDFIEKSSLKDRINYNGIDLSEPMITEAQKKWPDNKFILQDILSEPITDNSYDYIVTNGVFTEKQNLSYQEMISYFKNLIKAIFKSSKIGIAFNVMNHHVDWKRDDLFHLPFDELAQFLTKECSRNFLIRSDYGLYEYTVYLFKKPNE